MFNKLHMRKQHQKSFFNIAVLKKVTRFFIVIFLLSPDCLSQFHALFTALNFQLLNFCILSINDHTLPLSKPGGSTPDHLCESGRSKLGNGSTNITIHFSSKYLMVNS